ncbi:MAG: PASTA domain-containing protein [Moheibacter sp.]
MNFFKTFTKWQFWGSLLLMCLFCFGAYHFIFRVWLYSYTNHNQEIEIPDLKAMNLSQALKTLDSLKLTYEIDSVRYDSSKAPHAILDFFPETGFKVKEGRKIFVKANPKGWLPTSLPDIVGKSKRLAYTQLKLAGLEVGDTIYRPDIAKDAVLDVIFRGKQITQGTQLPRFSKVDLVLGRGVEYGVKTPNLVGLALEEARSAIFSKQFANGRINVEGGVSDSSKLIVFYQYPLPDDNYDQGLPIDLWLSEKERGELKSKIKELDLQFRNFGPNDSIAAAKFEEEFKLKEKDIPKDGNEKKKAQTHEIPDEQPSGMKID